LLDIKVKEPDLTRLVSTGRLVYNPPSFMKVSTCVKQMIEVEERRGEGVCAKHKLAVGLARVGADDQMVKAGTLEELAVADLGDPLHSVVLLGSMTYELELDFLLEFAIDKDNFRRNWDKGGYSN